MSGKKFESMNVRPETARAIRFAAVLSGMTVVDYCDQVVRVWIQRSIQAGATSTPERLRRIIEDEDDAPRAGKLIPFKK